MSERGSIAKFWGHGDDIIEWELITPYAKNNRIINEEFSSNDKSDITKILVSTIGGARQVHVFAMYDGCWHFSVRQVEEGRLIPENWKISITQADCNNYSTCLTIDALVAGDLFDRPVVVLHDFQIDKS